METLKQAPENGEIDNSEETKAGLEISPPTDAPSPVLSGSSSNDTQNSNSSSTNKLVGHNYNGTIVYTSTPKNDAELQLYRVMQRASLLSYYDTLLEMGGDDVQQLCDAGEEEFLEIMALVGMASKPLHVRRLQKALQEWLLNPLMFQTPLAAGPSTSLPRPHSVNNITSSPLSSSLPFANGQSQSSFLTPGSLSCGTGLQQLGEANSSNLNMAVSPAHGSSRSVSPGFSPGSPLNQAQPTLDNRQIQQLEDAAQRLVDDLPDLKPKYHNTKRKVSKELQAVLNMTDDNPLRMNQIRKFSAIYGRFDCKRKPEKPLTLHEVSVNEAAAQICKHIPALLTRRDELFPLARQVVRESGYHYSKGHSKSYAVSNLTRGSYGHSYRSHDGLFNKRGINELYMAAESLSQKQERMEQLQSELRKVTSRLDELSHEMQNISDENSEFSALKYQIEAVNCQKIQLLEEQAALISSMNHIPKKRGRKPNCLNFSYNFDKPEGDEIDSQYSYSNPNSPYQDMNESDNNQDNEDGQSKQSGMFAQTHFQVKNEDDFKSETKPEHLITANSDYSDFYSEDKFQVIATKGEDIIAVTNPALLMSPSSITPATITLKKERHSPVEESDT